MAHVDFSPSRFHELLDQEWLATNGIGGYASSTVPGLNTRKYHGLLVAAMSPPARRMVILSRVEESVRTNGNEDSLACCEYPGVIYPLGHQRLRGFANDPFPRWAFQGKGWTIQKSLELLNGENTVCLTYTLLTAHDTVELSLRPLLALRGIHELMYQWNGRLFAENRGKSSSLLHVPPTNRTPEVFFAHDGQFDSRPDWYLATIYRREKERGYAGLEDLWTPGTVRWQLKPGQSVHFVCSLDPIDLESVLCKTREQSTAAITGATTASDETAANLSRAASQFVVHGKSADPTKPVVAINTQYPWSAPSIRDALISFTGLLLVPKRFTEAKAFLRSVIGLLQRHQLPSELPEDAGQAVFGGTDVALWLFPALHDYLRYTGDASFAREALDALLAIIAAHRGGKVSNVQVIDDGLLANRMPGGTWMDARSEHWVITPRIGQTVELNALWYNALAVASDWCAKFDRPEIGTQLLAEMTRVRSAFNQKFWNERAGCCFDCVSDDKPDDAVRPNQLFAVSLPYPVLAPERHAKMLQTIQQSLLTPLGIRTLAPDDAKYRGKYAGDVVARDQAYHQGPAYPWLLGPYIRAFVRVAKGSPQARAAARDMLQACVNYMQSTGLGQIPELFDGDAPHRPGGAIASARSVAELLRAYVEDILSTPPQLPIAPKNSQLAPTK
jgi:predicted glycogen debranching enzyme